MFLVWISDLLLLLLLWLWLWWWWWWLLLLLLLLSFECYLYKLLLPSSRYNFIPANSPCFPRSLQVFQQISRDLFQNFFINFIIFEMSKKIIKQEMDLVLLSELFSIRKYKEEESNWRILTSSMTGQKSTNQIAQYMVEGWCGFCMLLSTLGTFERLSGDFRRVFRHCRKWHSCNAKIPRRPDFGTSGVGRYVIWSFLVKMLRNETSNNCSGISMGTCCLLTFVCSSFSNNK